MSPENEYDCRTCGACCAYSAEWPRFALESAEAISIIPTHFVNALESGMRCEGDRCSALCGTVGSATTCSVYSSRPDVCKECLPGDHACNLARAKFGLSTV